MSRHTKKFILYWCVPTVVLLVGNAVVFPEVFKETLLNANRTILGLYSVCFILVLFATQLLSYYFLNGKTDVSKKSKFVNISFKGAPILCSVFSFLFVLFILFDGIDETRNTRNIIQKLEYDPEYPFVGLWMDNVHDDYGFVLEKYDEGLYLEYVCGQRGCESHIFARKTKVVNDSKYHVVHADMIQKKIDGEFRLFSNHNK